jgi:hypothetical protein
MAATTAGTKTVNTAAAPHLSAAYLTTLLSTPLELLTIGQLIDVQDALNRFVDGNVASKLVGDVLR